MSALSFNKWIWQWPALSPSSSPLHSEVQELELAEMFRADSSALLDVFSVPQLSHTENIYCCGELDAQSI